MSGVTPPLRIGPIRIPLISDGRHHRGPFLKVLGRLGHDDAKFANHDAVDHQCAIAEKIHPVLHPHARKNVPRTQLQRVLPVKRIAVRVSDGRPDHVGREGRISMLVDPPDSPDPLLRVSILEREILSDNDFVPVAASHEIRAETTLRTSSTRFKDAPRPYRTLEERVRFEPRHRRGEGLRLESAAPAEENAENDKSRDNERLDTKSSDHGPSNCTKRSTSKSGSVDVVDQPMTIGTAFGSIKLAGCPTLITLRTKAADAAPLPAPA